MAVHTHIEREQLLGLLAKYDVGLLKNFTGITAGVENSNFIVETSKGKFILTIFEGRTDLDSLSFFMDLKIHLVSNDLPSPHPVKSKNDKFIELIVGKKCALVSFLPGKSVENLNDISVNNCYETGKILAKMRVAVASFKQKRSNGESLPQWKKIFNVVRDKMPAENQVKIFKVIELLEREWVQFVNDKVEKTVIHADLFPDNVFFDEQNRLSGVIDFYFACYDYSIYDLAIAVSAWCFDEKDIFRKDRYDNMISGYEEIKRINDIEKKHFKNFLIAACMRFTMSRYYDFFNQKKDSLTIVKDPLQYLQRMEFFADSNFSSF